MNPPGDGLFLPADGQLKCLRINAELAAKCGGKIAGIAVSDARGGLQHSCLAALQKRTRVFHSTLAQIAESGGAKNLTEASLESGLAQADLTRERSERWPF